MKLYAKFIAVLQSLHGFSVETTMKASLYVFLNWVAFALAGVAEVAWSTVKIPLTVGCKQRINFLRVASVK